MSEDTVQVDEGTYLGDRLLASLRRNYEYVILASLMAFMLWVRTRSYERFVRNGEVFFGGNDPYYHLREVTYTVKHWPATMPYDPWTYFPYGTSSDQFGTLFDQLVATAALAWGMGDPSQLLVGKTLLLAPAVFGTLAAVPTYFIGKRLAGKFGGLFGVLILALLPGTFLRRGLVGTSDHNIAEVLFQALAVLAIMVAVAVAEREKPVYELLLDRDVAALRRPLGWGILAGIATGLYVWVWPPSVLLLGIVGIFLLVKMVATFYNGKSPEPVAFAGATAMTTTGLLALLPLNGLELQPTAFGLLQPLVAFGIAAGAVFLAWLAREWDSRDIDTRLYPFAVFGMVLVGLGLVAVVLPDLFRTIAHNFERFIGFSSGAATRTIGEAKPFFSQVNAQLGLGQSDVVFREYGAMFFTALAALGYLIWRPMARSTDSTDQLAVLGSIVVIGLVWMVDIGGPLASTVGVIGTGVLWEMFIVGAVVLYALVRGDHDGEEMFVVVWSLFIVAAAFTQVRFNYYLAVVVAVLNAYAIGQAMRLLGVMRADGRLATDIEPYQIMALMLAVLIVLPGLMVPVQIGSAGQQAYTTNTAMQVGNSTAPSAFVRWEGSLDWMEDNTPQEGDFAGAGNEMDIYGTYAYPNNNDFEYPDGSYGVMSWWDYGHWITVGSERVPNANPFQQGATTAANFLLSPNESQANDIVENLGDDGEQTRYVMVDWKMVETDAPGGSKFGAPTVFYDAQNVSSSDFYSSLYSSDSGQRVFNIKEQRYYDSLAVRLYKFHGSRARAQPYVLDWRPQQGPDGRIFKLTPSDGEVVKEFGSMKAAEAYVANDSSSMIGGFGLVPSEDVPALENYRLVKVSDATALGNRGYYQAALRKLQGLNVSQGLVLRNTPNWVKTFEKVPGASVSGQGPTNTTVTASVTMRMTTTNETFTYEQAAETGPDGEFTMTLPYSTTGYDEYGPENGYTNVSVRADGPYTFSTSLQSNGTAVYTHRGTANVSETQVLGLADGPVEVDLERTVLFGGSGNNSTQTGNDSSTGNSTSLSDSVLPADGEGQQSSSDDGQAATASASVGSAAPAARSTSGPAAVAAIRG